MIVAYLGRNVKDYCENFLLYLEKIKIFCPVCGNNTEFHDRYDRHIHINDKIEWIAIQRVICVGCGKTHAILPDFIRPYKHYSAADIEFVLRDVEEGTIYEQVEATASISTVKRWVKEFKQRGCQAIGALRAILNNIFDKTINEVRLTGLKMFETLEYILDNFPKAESNSLSIGEANIWLTHYTSGIYV